MVIWNRHCLPPSADPADEESPYYLVRIDGYRPVFAMFMGGEWWTSYITRLDAKVTGWSEL